MIKYILLTLCFLDALVAFSQDKNTIKLKENPQLKVEQLSSFSTCYKLELVLKKKCYLKEIKKHIIENFNTNFVTNLELKPGKSDLILAFKTSEYGKIMDIKAKAENEKIESIAPQLIKSLTKSSLDESFKNLWAVNYSLPISLNIDK